MARDVGRPHEPQLGFNLAEDWTSMLRDAVTIDAVMTVSDALLRLAQHGYWLDPAAPESNAFLAEYVARIRKIAVVPRLVLAGDDAGSDTPDRASAEHDWERTDAAQMTVADAARLLARPLDEGRVAIRRQQGVTIFWYARSVEEVLRMLVDRAPDMSVGDALNLHEYTSDKTIQASELDESAERNFPGVVLRGQEPVAVGEPNLQSAAPPELDSQEVRSAGVGHPVPTPHRRPSITSIQDRSPTESMRPPAPPSPPPPTPAPQAAGGDAGNLAGGAGAGAGAPAAEPPVRVRAHPRLDAPQLVQVGTPFDVVVGLGATAQSGVASSGQIELSAPTGATTIEVDVQLVADGFLAPDGWRRQLAVAVADPTAASVSFSLVALPQDEPVRLTSVIVHYIADGVARGSAARNIVVERTAGVAPEADDRGQSWLTAGEPPPTITLEPTTARPDVELDIAKPDGNATGGRYRCVVRNAHGVPVPDGSLEIDLGDDAKTFAKQLIDQVRQWSGDDLVDNLLENVGAKVAAKLPEAFWKTLRAVAEIVTDRPITFQLNSSEPYVPWELALVDPPLDPARPRYLSAQLVMGRWILGDSAVTSPPRTSIVVKTMAVMAGMYSVSTGLRPLPEAQAEAQALTATFSVLPAVPLDCTPANLKLLLDASLNYNFQPVGGAEAVHFAGHGEVDPSRPGEAALYLSNGKALTPLFFRRSRLGTQYSPFIFLNACMVGTAGEMLGDYGGFPGNCLAGGFSGLVAPLWAVNDTVARTFALTFYDEALAVGDHRSVAEVLRDLRANYKSEHPVSSYLAYVYYGNPFLTLSRAPQE